MIYIVSGIAKAGKTYVARRILQERRIAVFSTDYLMMSLSKANPTIGVDHTDDDRDVARALEPYLFAMIETMAENAVDQVIEGVHFLPAFAARLIQAFPGKIRIVYLGYDSADPNAKAAELQLHAADVENAWFLAYSPAAMYKLVRYLIGESERLKTEAEIYGLPYFDIVDIVRDVDKVLACLFEKR